MNRYRQRHPDFGKVAKKAPTTYGEMNDDTEVSEAADDIYTVAASHRDTVKAKDAAAKARRKKTRG
jgi:hypothetical protein